jgi:hypothetical protein
MLVSSFSVKCTLVCNHQYVCHHEWYQRNYYDNLLCEV